MHICTSMIFGDENCREHPFCKGCEFAVMLPDPEWIGKYIDEHGNLLIPTFRGIPVLPVYLTLYKNASIKE